MKDLRPSSSPEIPKKVEIILPERVKSVVPFPVSQVRLTTFDRWSLSAPDGSSKNFQKIADLHQELSLLRSKLVSMGGSLTYPQECDPAEKVKLRALAKLPKGDFLIRDRKTGLMRSIPAWSYDMSYKAQEFFCNPEPEGAVILPTVIPGMGEAVLLH
jgi:hypothetical protein